MKKIILILFLLINITFANDTFKESAIKGYFEAEGYSAPGQNKFAARISAKVDAQRRLLEIIKGAKVTSETTIVNGTLSSDIMISQVKGLVQGARVVHQEYDRSSGTAMIRLAIGYKTVMKEVFKNKEFQKVFYEKEKSSAPEFKIQKITAEVKKVTYDALIVDARATDMEPAYINRIFTNNKIVYDPTKVPQKIIVERGLAAYTNDINKAKAILETYNVHKPLIVKALKTKELKSDILISIEEAKEVVSSNMQSGFLESAKIVFVLQ